MNMAASVTVKHVGVVAHFYFAIKLHHTEGVHDAKMIGLTVEE